MSLGAPDVPAASLVEVSPYAISERGPNHRVWQHVMALTDASGTTNYFTNSYTYDNAMRRSGLNLQAPNADPWSQTYGYDLSGRMYTIASPVGTFGYTYDATRQLEVANLALPNGAKIVDTYDTVARLASTTLKNSGNTNLNSHAYVYNLGGQRTQQTRIDTSYVNYAYDSIGRLTNAAGFEGTTAARLNEKFGYGYDAAQNLTSRTNNALVQSFGVNTLNELSTITRNSANALTVTGTTSSNATSVTINGSAANRYADYTFASSTNFTLTNGNNSFTAIAADSAGRHDTNTVTVNLPASVGYTYDLNGNLLSDGERAFDYDDENELIRVTVTNAWKSEFTYDGRLRMRVRKEFTWTGGAFVQTNEVHYVYDANVVIQERDANNLPLITYTRGKDLSGSLQGAGGIGGLLSRTDMGSQQTAFYHADGSGNITALINAQQFPVARYLYDPFGNILSLSGPLADANMYRFSSKEYHQNSGLLYYLYRFYDPLLQRWLNKDPIAEKGGINLYGFVGNSALNECDLFGLTLLISTSPFPNQRVDVLGPYALEIPDPPPGVSLYANMNLAACKQQESQNLMTSVGIHSGFPSPWDFSPILWFQRQEKTGGPWDFKDGNYVNAKQYDQYGNFHYGAVGTAMGLDSWTLQTEAGRANTDNKEGDPGWRFWSGSGTPPYGDRPLDNYWIRVGIKYATEHPVKDGPGPLK
ncbi:MAG: type secretion protein Rhs [Pedosphaera sp.]|nr:type secretion protein Rhs [Pedosphaera sp.]